MDSTTKYTFSPGQQLMIDWCELIKQFTPYMSSWGKDVWDEHHAQLTSKTGQFLATAENDPYSFVAQVTSLQQAVEQWLKEYHEMHIARKGHIKIMSNNLEMRQTVIDSLKYYLDHHHMSLIPVGSVQRGPGYAQETREGPVKPLSFEGYPCIGIVLSVGLKGQEPPDWLMDIIHRIECFAINELNKVESKAEDEEQSA